MSHPWRSVLAFIAGAIFSIGLVFGGMTQPSKVIGFLDFFGDWDPSLAFVMIGAIAVNGSAYWLLARRRRFPLLDTTLRLPQAQAITPKLVIGSALFGIGWGLGGYCPGPALVSLASMAVETGVFVIAMVAAMALHDLIVRSKLERTP